MLPGNIKDCTIDSPNHMKVGNGVLTADCKEQKDKQHLPVSMMECSLHDPRQAEKKASQLGLPLSLHESCRHFRSETDKTQKSKFVQFHICEVLESQFKIKRDQESSHIWGSEVGTLQEQTQEDFLRR